MSPTSGAESSLFAAQGQQLNTTLVGASHGNGLQDVKVVLKAGRNTEKPPIDVREKLREAGVVVCSISSDSDSALEQNMSTFNPYPGGEGSLHSEKYERLSIRLHGRITGLENHVIDSQVEVEHRLKSAEEKFETSTVEQDAVNAILTDQFAALSVSCSKRIKELEQDCMVIIDISDRTCRLEQEFGISREVLDRLCKAEQNSLINLVKCMSDLEQTSKMTLDFDDRLCKVADDCASNFELANRITHLEQLCASNEEMPERLDKLEQDFAAMLELLDESYKFIEETVSSFAIESRISQVQNAIAVLLGSVDRLFKVAEKSVPSQILLSRMLDLEQSSLGMSGDLSNGLRKLAKAYASQSSRLDELQSKIDHLNMPHHESVRRESCPSGEFVTKNHVQLFRPYKSHASDETASCSHEWREATEEKLKKAQDTCENLQTALVSQRLAFSGFKDQAKIYAGVLIRQQAETEQVLADLTRRLTHVEFVAEGVHNLQAEQRNYNGLLDHQRAETEQTLANMARRLAQVESFADSIQDLQAEQTIINFNARLHEIILHRIDEKFEAYDQWQAEVMRRLDSLNDYQRLRDEVQAEAIKRLDLLDNDQQRREEIQAEVIKRLDLLDNERRRQGENHAEVIERLKLIDGDQQLRRKAENQANDNLCKLTADQHSLDMKLNDLFSVVDRQNRQVEQLHLTQKTELVKVNSILEFLDHTAKTLIHLEQQQQAQVEASKARMDHPKYNDSTIAEIISQLKRVIEENQILHAENHVIKEELKHMHNRTPADTNSSSASIGLQIAASALNSANLAQSTLLNCHVCLQECRHSQFAVQTERAGVQQDSAAVRAAQAATQDDRAAVEALIQNTSFGDRSRNGGTAARQPLPSKRASSPTRKRRSTEVPPAAEFLTKKHRSSLANRSSRIVAGGLHNVEIIYPSIEDDTQDDSIWPGAPNLEQSFNDVNADFGATSHAPGDHVSESAEPAGVRRESSHSSRGTRDFPIINANATAFLSNSQSPVACPTQKPTTANTGRHSRSAHASRQQQSHQERVTSQDFHRQATPGPSRQRAAPRSQTNRPSAHPLPNSSATLVAGNRRSCAIVGCPHFEVMVRTTRVLSYEETHTPWYCPAHGVLEGKNGWTKTRLSVLE